MSAFSERVYDCVRRIPKGRIANYGSVAALVGEPCAARGVGYALSDVPWWRVVNRRGTVSTSRVSGMAQWQRALLESEGVVFDDAGEASWQRFGWVPGE